MATFCNAVPSSCSFPNNIVDISTTIALRQQYPLWPQQKPLAGPQNDDLYVEKSTGYSFLKKNYCSRSPVTHGLGDLPLATTLSFKLRGNIIRELRTPPFSWHANQEESTSYFSFLFLNNWEILLQFSYTPFSVFLCCFFSTRVIVKLAANERNGNHVLKYK